MGDMLPAPVIPFQLVTASLAEAVKSADPKYDIFSNAEDLVESWGPGKVIFQNEQRLPFTIRVGREFIYATSAEFSKYHRGMTAADATRFQGGIVPTQKYLIGCEVVVKSQCHEKKTSAGNNRVLPYNSTSKTGIER